MQLSLTLTADRTQDLVDRLGTLMKESQRLVQWTVALSKRRPGMKTPLALWVKREIGGQ